jgi:hypothetical protein
MKRVIYLLILVLITGCNPDGVTLHTQECPGYDNGFFAQWFPYNTGDVYYFSDSSGARDTLAIDTVIRTAPYKIEEKPDGVNEACFSEGIIRSYNRYSSTRASRASLEIKHELNGGMGNDVVFISFNKLSIHAKITNYDITNLSWTDTAAHQMERAATVTVNGRTFNEVVIITTTDAGVAANDGVDKLYIAKGKGIVAYRKYPAGDVYARE